MKELYESMGINELTKESYRLNSVFLRGIDDLNEYEIERWLILLSKISKFNFSLKECRIVERIAYYFVSECVRYFPFSGRNEDFSKANHLYSSLAYSLTEFV